MSRPDYEDSIAGGVDDETFAEIAGDSLYPTNKENN